MRHEGIAGGIRRLQTRFRFTRRPVGPQTSTSFPSEPRESEYAALAGFGAALGGITVAISCWH
jgi:hypothetical protein